MKIGLTVDVSVLVARFNDPEKKIAYAVANAINKTAKLAQRAIQLHAQDTFTIRKPEFVLKQVAVLKPFASASQGRPFAEIAVGQKPRLLLPMFEHGGDRGAFVGKNVAVPVVGGARPSAASPVTESLLFKNLALRPFRGATRTNKRGVARAKAAGQQVQWRGEAGTYLVPEVGVFQRIGAAIAKALYIFKPRVHIPATLDFVGTVRGVVARNFAPLLRQEIKAAVDYDSRAMAA